MQALDATKRVHERAAVDRGGSAAAAAGAVLRAGAVRGARAGAARARAAARRRLARPRLRTPTAARPILHTRANRDRLFHVHLRMDTKEIDGKTDCEGIFSISHLDESVFFE